jgi:hypothetical protein
LKRRFLIACLGLICLAASSWAGGVTFWEITKKIDTEKGDSQGVSISDDGIIELAPKFTEIFNTQQRFTFASVADSAGNIYIGTGHEGHIYKVDKTGQGKLWTDLAELDVTALAVDSAGVVYAGTSPDGKVYRLSADGKPTVVFDPEDKYIWSLVVDKTGQLFVGSGDKGVIYKVAANGTSSVFAKTNEKHIMSLSLDSRGQLLVGTDPGGLVLRFDNQGKAFALFDSPVREIHRVVTASDGTIYALGIVGTTTSESKTPAPPATDVSATTGSASLTVTFDEDSVISSTSSATAPNSARPTDSSAKAFLYRITPDGGNDVLWTSQNTALSMTLNRQGEVLVGTTQKGRIFAINPRNRNYRLLVQSTEEQTTTLLNTGAGIYATASSNGKLYRLAEDPVAEGSYTSPVHDTKVTAAWGRISWRGQGKVQLQTRTGNTEIPDNTWSDWSTSYDISEGQNISSPAARFIQWRARLQPQSNLTAVKVAYLPRNVAPEVRQLIVLPPGIALQEIPQQPVDPGIVSAGLDPATFGFPGNLQPRKVFQKGARSLQWQAEDRNADVLTYSVYYRTVNENEWHLLKEDQRNNYLTLDADGLPDGKYFFRVVASDEASNAADRALNGEFVSDLVEIDNTPPQVVAGQPRRNGQQVEVSFVVTDNLSNLKRAEFSVNGGKWQTIFPQDGIADSRNETYLLKVTLLANGEQVIAFRCYDDSTNVGANKVTVR